LKEEIPNTLSNEVALNIDNDALTSILAGLPLAAFNKCEYVRVLMCLCPKNASAVNNEAEVLVEVSSIV